MGGQVMVGVVNYQDGRVGVGEGWATIKMGGYVVVGEVNYQSERLGGGGVVTYLNGRLGGSGGGQISRWEATWWWGRSTIEVGG